MSEKVLLCGVGGQGTILAAHVLAGVVMASGSDVKVSEIHGMSQRGGAVTTVVNFGDDAKTMVSDAGSNDIIVSFEIIEAMRNIDQLKSDGTLIVNDEIIKPASVLTGKSPMPSDIRRTLADANAVLVPAQAIANKAGNSKVTNIVILGALSAVLDFPPDTWREVITAHVPPKTIDVNLEAFDMGRAFIEEHRSDR